MRRFLIVTGTLTIVIAGSLPALNGWWLRHRIAAELASLPQTPDLRLEHTASHGGWIHSTLHLRLHGAAVDSPPDGIPLNLRLSHGPLIWNLPDTPWGLAHLQLGTEPDYDGPGADRYSGAAILRLSTDGLWTTRGILGAAVFDGDHQVHFSGSWPLLSLLLPDRSMWPATARLYMEIDAKALQDTPASDLLDHYQQRGWVRLNQGRALTDIRLDQDMLRINGTALSLRHLLAGTPEVPVSSGRH